MSEVGVPYADELSMLLTLVVSIPVWETEEAEVGAACETAPSTPSRRLSSVRQTGFQARWSLIGTHSASLTGASLHLTGSPPILENEPRRCILSGSGSYCKGDGDTT